MNWTSLSLSLVPIAALVVALSVFKAKAYKVTAGAAGLALVLALAFFRSAFPAAAILPTVADGVSFALYPICLVVLAAALVADRAGDAFKRMLPWFFAVLLLACLVVCVSAR